MRCNGSPSECTPDPPCADVDVLRAEPVTSPGHDGVEGGTTMNGDEGFVQDGEFSVVRLVPSDPTLTLRPAEFESFLLQIKSETKTEEAMAVDPLTFLRRNVPMMKLAQGPVSGSLPRAELNTPTRPWHAAQVWNVFDGGRLVSATQYKYAEDYDPTAEQVDQ